MALTVGTDTFISVADADSYWQARNGGEWIGASQSLKEAALIQATEFLDNRYDWPGYLDDDSQRLSWPRINAHDDEGRELLDIPTKVEHATAWLAGHIVAGNELFAVSGKDDIISRVKAGSVEVEWNAEETLSSSRVSFKYLDSILSGIVNTNISEVRLVRV